MADTKHAGPQTAGAAKLATPRKLGRGRPQLLGDSPPSFGTRTIKQARKPSNVTERA